MSRERKTKDVICRTCGRKNRIPKGETIGKFVCVRKMKGGQRCFGCFRLKRKDEK